MQQNGKLCLKELLISDPYVPLRTFPSPSIGMKTFVPDCEEQLTSWSWWQAWWQRLLKQKVARDPTTNPHFLDLRCKSR